MGSRWPQSSLRSRRTTPRGGRGGGGGKAPSQGEHGQHNTSRTQCRDGRAKRGPCVKWHKGTRKRGSRRCCTMSTSSGSGRPTGRCAAGRAGGGRGDVGGLRAGPGANLRDLHRRLHAGSYRARPSRGRTSRRRTGGCGRSARHAGGQDRPAGRRPGAQRRLRGDFSGFSYGFRPGRSPHDALDALAAGIYKKKVNWILDADIRDFFTSLIRAGWRGFSGIGSRTSGSCG